MLQIHFVVFVFLIIFLKHVGYEDCERFGGRTKKERISVTNEDT